MALRLKESRWGGGQEDPRGGKERTLCQPALTFSGDLSLGKNNPTKPQNYVLQLLLGCAQVSGFPGPVSEPSFRRERGGPAVFTRPRLMTQRDPGALSPREPWSLTSNMRGRASSPGLEGDMW